MASTEENETFDGAFVLVLGLTGAGKTTFINHITNSSFPVGHGMNACTTTSDYATTLIDGVEVAFVDTPGLDDPEKSDAEVVIDVTTWIEKHLGGKRQVTAALYLHSIATRKMHGSAIRNFNIFSKLVGSNSMKNVGLVSTHWDTVPAIDAEDREAYLIANAWSIMIASGARIYRLHNDQDSSHNMAVDLLKAQPTFIKIQREMAKEFEAKPLSRTEVGEDVYRELQKRISTEQSNIRELEKQLTRAELEVPGMKAELENSLEKSRRRLAQFERDSKRVEKVPSWGETAWNVGKRWGPTVISLGTQIVRDRRANEAIIIAQKQADTAMAQLVAHREQAAAAAASADSGIGGMIFSIGAGHLVGRAAEFIISKAFGG